MSEIIIYKNISDMLKVIDTREPKGLFLRKGQYKWIAIDNSYGHAFVEEFDTKKQAIKWLKNEFEVKDF